jgi:hypothetical protein
MDRAIHAWWLRRSAGGKVLAVVIVAILGLALVASRNPPGAPHPSGSPLGALEASPSTSTSPSLVATASATPSASPQADLNDDETAPSPGEVIPTPASTTAPASAAAGRLAGEPDPALTPGALNPAVTQSTIGSTICVSGWTATVRPSSSYTSARKIEQIGEYGYSDTSTADYEEDHLIPLELGGAPSDPKNLWPEPYAITLADGTPVGARVKDADETALKKQVCLGLLTLAAAQQKIGVHWVHHYFGIPLATSSPTPTAIPTASPPTRPSSLTVRLVSIGSPVAAGSSTTVAARTSPGAICGITVTLPSGRVSTVAALLQSHTADSAGAVSWLWRITSNTGAGSAHVSVRCTAGGRSASASGTFVIA